MLEQGRLRSEYGTGYPRYVEQTFRRYLACGLPSEGLARVRCASCGSERLVAFSCKLRGVCPSCSARRMADLAAQLVDGLLPQVPYRQVVFTFPVPLRLAMFRQPSVLSLVLQRCVRALFAQLRRRAKAQGVDQPLPAALTAIQRFGGSLNVNVHV